MRPRRIALTGGIATGKSTVSKMFAEAGAIILDADKIARDVVEPGSPCFEELRNLLGPSYFEEDGRLERRKLRECIINDSHCRSQVNEILHPHICAAMEKEWELRRKADPARPVIFDIPLLFEANMARRFDTIILVHAPAAIQIERLMKRDGLTKAEAEQTLTMQLPIESKKALAHIIIDNSLDLDHTRRQVSAIWEDIKAP